jgi:hypothetical protein
MEDYCDVTSGRFKRNNHNNNKIQTAAGNCGNTKDWYSGGIHFKSLLDISLIYPIKSQDSISIGS